MDENLLYPFSDDADWLLRYCKLPVHTGAGTIDQHGDPDGLFSTMIRKISQSTASSAHVDAEPTVPEFAASFFLPAAGNCRIFLLWPGESPLSCNFGEGLTVIGTGPEGPFRLTCPRYYAKAVSKLGERPGWAIAAPINVPTTVSYGDERPIAAVTAVINNLDFEYGNIHSADRPVAAETLRVEAAGKTVDFVRRSERNQLRRMIDAGLIGTTSFVTFSFCASPGESEADLTAFAQNISSFCCYVVGQHTGIPVVSFFDAERQVIRRSLRAAIQSRFRSGSALRVLHAADGLPKLFRQGFDEHCRMQQSDLWQKMPYVFASIEDPPYLEQKYATLMAAVELLIRSSAIEGGHLNQSDAESKSLPELINVAKGILRWNVPKHYTESERYRKTRNAVGHGGQLPNDVAHVRADFDKWKLFLCRRLFIRLGFDGEVASPQGGWASSSPVDEFSKEHNSFLE